MLKDFIEFRKNYTFNMPELKEKEGLLYLNGELIRDEKKSYSSGEGFINAGYKFMHSVARSLSNLFPMEFEFRGKQVKSIEGILQGCKYQDIETQNLVLNYFGIDAYHIRGCNSLDFWGEKGILYWQGQPMERGSEEYQEFIDEIYYSAAKNPLYKRAILATGDKYLCHDIGKKDIKDTVLTRYEFELRLNALKDFIKTNELN